jgi:transcriptional regulator with XRE-family HTH domain
METKQPPTEIAGQPMTTPLQAARHAKGWSQSRAAWELIQLAKRKKISVASNRSLKTQLSRWENGHITPDFYRPLLCDLYGATSAELGFGVQGLPSGFSGENESEALISKPGWTRDDLRNLSASFDDAISRSALSDIEMLAHEWLSADKPQLIELDAGRHVSDTLIATIEHRVIQLRRADDFISGRTSHALVREELQATTNLLNDAALTESQARRVLTAAGELFQLAAWVAADAGLYRDAARYAKSGILAAHAAGDTPLAANVISTFSYQLANTGNPRQAALLARTAYAGARHSTTATTKALLLERVAWADARSGDTASCERMLGLVETSFDQAKPGDDPDWVYWLNREEVNVMAGRCYTELKRPDRAKPLLLDAISVYDDARIRENTLYLSWLAEDHILLGEIDAASAISTQILDLKSRANSARTDERLRHLARLLKNHKDAKSAAEFLDRYKGSGN